MFNPQENTGRLFHCLLQIKMFHFQTLGDSKHRAYGELYDQLNGFIDEFLETYMGKYGRLPLTQDLSIQITDITKMDEEGYIDELVNYFISYSDQLDSKLDSDLLNMRDEILGHVNHIKYLLKLQY